MGCDIHGYVEVRPFKSDPDWWDSCINIKAIIGRNYDMFGLLFGVRNYCNYKSIAEERGLPTYAKWQSKSDESDDREPTLVDREKWNGDAHSDSYISWAEIEKINWEQESDDIDERIHEYEVNADGKEEYIGKASMYGFLTKGELDRLSKFETIEKKTDNRITRYKIEKTRLKDAISGDWQVLFDLMKRLAQQRQDPESVRLVVWFDN